MKLCVVRSSFFSSSFATEKKKGRPDNPVFAAKKKQPDNLFLGIFLQKGFLIQIRFREQFSSEIFINLS